MSGIRRALITGASAGIGAEFARQLAARGTELVLVARRARRLDELADEVSVDVEVISADLADPADRATVEDRLTDEGRPVDLLVNNAGLGAYGRFVDLEGSTQTQMIDVNVTAMMRLARAALPGMLARDRGGLINVASTAAFQPNPDGAVYGATKAFVLSLSEALHEEVRDTDVRVLALCPGVTPTEFQQVAGVNVPLPEAAMTSPERVVTAALRAFARGRAVEVPGLVNKVTATASSFGPSQLTRRVSGLAHRTVMRR